MDKGDRSTLGSHTGILKTCTVDLNEQCRWRYANCIEGCAVQIETIIYCTARHSKFIRGQGCVDDSPGVSEFEFHFAQNLRAAS